MKITKDQVVSAGKYFLSHVNDCVDTDPSIVEIEERSDGNFYMYCGERWEEVTSLDPGFRWKKV